MGLASEKPEFTVEARPFSSKVNLGTIFTAGKNHE
jgi:hypothetical protein